MSYKKRRALAAHGFVIGKRESHVLAIALGRGLPAASEEARVFAPTIGKLKNQGMIYSTGGTWKATRAGRWGYDQNVETREKVKNAPSDLKVQVDEMANVLRAGGFKVDVGGVR